MNAEPYKIEINPESELAANIDTAETERRPIVLDKKGVRYRVIREADDIWAGYDPDAVIAGMGVHGYVAAVRYVIEGLHGQTQG